jgi:hypothetical protein
LFVLLLFQLFFEILLRGVAGYKSFYARASPSSGVPRLPRACCIGKGVKEGDVV